MRKNTKINELQQAFDEFHAENPEVYYYFRRFAFEAIDNGKEKFSAYAIVHRIRWEIEFETNDPSYKINNNHIAFYARLFIQQFPEHADFFELRALRGA